MSKSKAEIAKTFRVIIRHLPPAMDEKELIKQMQPLPDYVDYYMVESDECWLPYKARRAYFDFLDIESATNVMRRFDGYTFIDGNGVFVFVVHSNVLTGDESTAVAEWAPSQ